MRRIAYSVMVLAVAAYGCVGSVVKEEGVEAERSFLLEKEGPVKIAVSTVGRVALRGSVPGKVVWKYRNIAWAGSKERALALVSKEIGFNVTEERKDNTFEGRVEIPPLGVGERAYTDVEVLLPLERTVGATVGISEGPLVVEKMKGTLVVRYGTPGLMRVTLFDGTVDVSMPGGEAILDGAFIKGRVEMGDGDVTLYQKALSQSEPFTIHVSRGTVTVQVTTLYEGAITVRAPSFKNESKVKFSRQGGVWKAGGKGPGLEITVERGKVRFLRRFIKSFAGRKTK